MYPARLLQQCSRNPCCIGNRDYFGIFVNAKLEQPDGPEIALDVNLPLLIMPKKLQQS